jgi:L-rhamnose isomerase/sugar isomerase
LRGAFWGDVRGAVREWRKSRNLPLDPLQEFRASGYIERIKAERAHRNAQANASYA